ncbi:MAG: response regulator [Gaiellaceae bacterium]
MKAEHREPRERVEPARGVLIVDDHSGFRRSAHALLAEEGFDVVGEASSGAAALTLAAELAPEVVLLDIHLPDLDGFEVTRRLVAAHPQMQVVLVSSDEPCTYGSLVDESGARGFVLKNDLSGAAIERLLE